MRPIPQTFMIGILTNKDNKLIVVGTLNHLMYMPNLYHIIARDLMAYSNVLYVVSWKSFSNTYLLFLICDSESLLLEKVLQSFPG